MNETLAKDETLKDDLKAKIELEEQITATKREIKKFQKNEAADKKEQQEMNDIREQIKKIQGMTHILNFPFFFFHYFLF